MGERLPDYDPDFECQERPIDWSVVMFWLLLVIPVSIVTFYSLGRIAIAIITMTWGDLEEFLS